MEGIKKYKIGYTQGTFDMFHIGHLNLIRNAKQYCEKLIVGVNADALVLNYKSKTPVITEQERLEIVKAIRYVDNAIITTTLDKTEIIQKIPYEAIFIGDDWEGNERWRKTELELKAFGAKVVYLPYTNGVSSTELKSHKDKSVQD